jgi:hypothetical protein
VFNALQVLTKDELTQGGKDGLNQRSQNTSALGERLVLVEYNRFRALPHNSYSTILESHFRLHNFKVRTQYKRVREDGELSQHQICVTCGVVACVLLWLC